MFIGLIVLKKLKVLHKMRGFVCGYICRDVEHKRSEITKKQEEKKEQMSLFNRIEKFTWPTIDDIKGTLNSAVSSQKKEHFDEVAKTTDMKVAGNIPIPEPLFTLEQVDKDEDKVTKYIREVGLGAKYACPTNDTTVVPKDEYVSDWLGFTNKINKDSNQYIDMVDKVNKIYLMNNNEMPEFTGYKIQDVYDDLTKTNKDEFEKAYIGGNMPTFGTYTWYRDPKVVNKLIDAFGNPSGNMV